MSMYGTFMDITALLDTIEEEDEDGVERDKQEEEEENFVMTALFCAVEEGNLAGIQELLDSATHFDVNTSNKHGETALHMAASGGHVDIIEYLQSRGIDLNAQDKHGDTAVYWAARQGHLEVVRYLKEQGVHLNSQNKAGEAAIHVAARYGHTSVIEYLCQAGVDVNVQDKLGETPLHNAAWHGLPAYLCATLCMAGCHINAKNKEEETPLHCAAARGNLDCVKVLLDHGAELNVVDKRGSTPLHLSCRRHHTSITLLLLHAGCQFDVVDQDLFIDQLRIVSIEQYISIMYETPLHAASREGLLPVVQTLCAFGCRLDVVSKAGVTPLHLASRGGHTEVVRCLLLSGAEPDLPNKDGVTAEIMALAQGHTEVAELLTKLKPERREVFMRQLMPTNSHLHRIKLKLFGNSGVGKSTLVDSLKCGYFGSFFRKARLSSSSSVTNSPVKQKSQENGVPRHHSLPSQLSYEVAHGSYTKGIDVQQLNISGAGDLSVWDFSGYEPYLMLYDHFIGDPNCIHMVVFSLEEAQHVQLAQVTFWLNFLKARIPPFEPIGQFGKHPWPARVVLVATHADHLACQKNLRGEFISPEADLLLATVKEKFVADFDISDHIYVVDAHLAMSPELKALRTHIGELKASIVKSLPTSNGFLDAVVSTLPAWRKTTAPFPVLPWPNFMEFVRTRVNTLASEEHLKELMHQLQLVGEVIYLETEAEHDLVVLCPKWLCSDVIGQLLSNERILHSRPTGCFTVDDFQLMFSETDALDLLHVLEALEICTQCDIDGDIEYEFPCLNFVETLHGLWELDTKRFPNAVYGGVRIQCPRAVTNQLVHIFPRIQVQLRRSIIHEHNSPENDLYQWYHGSKYCSGAMESLVTLEHCDQVIEVKARGPEDMRTNLYYFMEDLVDVVDQVIDDLCPGMDFEKHLLSAVQLKEHQKTVHSYAPRTVLEAQLKGQTSMSLDEDKNEELADLVCFGSDEIKENLTIGVNLHISHLSIHTRRQLSMRLDPPEQMGRDWCLLAVTLGLTDNLPELDNTRKYPQSKTDRTLEEYSRDPSATIAKLLQKLQELGRQDSVDAILNSGPLFQVFHDESSQDDQASAPPPSQSSDNTLSSVSR